MNKFEHSASQSTRKGDLFSKFPRKKNYSNKQSYKAKYIIEGQTKQIGQVITHKSTNANTSIITFKFKQMPHEYSSHQKMGLSNVSSLKKKTCRKQIFLQTMRPIFNHPFNLTSFRIASVQMRRLESEICNRRSFKKQDDEQLSKLGLEVQGFNTNLNRTFKKLNSSEKCNNRKLTSSLRMKSNNGSELIPQSNSTQLIDFLRKPSFKKDHFIFSLSDKFQSPQNKFQIYRDFLWKMNYSHGIFVITPQDINTSYKAYIGKGNNSLMIKAILRRRAWWTFVDKQSQANFVWTQLKVNNLYLDQPTRKHQLTLKDAYSQSNWINMDKNESQISTEQKNIYAKIFNQIDFRNWKDHYLKNSKTEQKIGELTYVRRVGLMNKKILLKIQNTASLRLHNHLIQNYYIGNKKALFYNLRKYCEYTGQDVFSIAPLTFHITKGIDDPKYQLFLQTYKKLQEDKKTDKQLKNVWIMKPGENTNRGNGISVCFSLDDIQHRLKSKQKNRDGTLRTFILQKYMEKPLLFNSRKFDIRHYILITSFAGSMKGYWYKQGYVRTSSSIFTLKNSKDLFVHLTNDAIQKNGDNYGKYQSGNKVSYEELEKYIAKQSRKEEKKKGVSFFQEIYPQMRRIALEAVRSTYHLLDKTRKHHNFQLLGLDYMIDQSYKPYLIQVNTNPCLELSCPLLQMIIPQLIENTIKICVDPLFPPPQNLPMNKKNVYLENPLQQNKYELIFDELLEMEGLKHLFEGREKMDADLGNIEEDEQQFENDGIENWQESNIL